MARLSLRDWIRENRAEIDSAINAALFRHDENGGRGTIPNPPPSQNDEERRGWVLNDEGLYNWARSDRVNA
jgi:hypothetical protein